MSRVANTQKTQAPKRHSQKEESGRGYWVYKMKINVKEAGKYSS